MHLDLTEGGPVYGPFISRKQAQAQGLRHYFTGKPCKHGHVDLRYTSTGQCATCLRKWEKAYNADPVKHERRKRLNRESAANRMATSPEWIARRRAASARHRESFAEQTGHSRTGWYYRNDEQHRLAHACRSRVRQMVVSQGGIKSASTMELVGCTIQHLIQHFEKQFVEGMSWDNYGNWHIDHIRPCASFDLTDPEQQKQCFHYSNLQPLWAEDNMAKGAKWAA